MFIQPEAEKIDTIEKLLESLGLDDYIDAFRDDGVTSLELLLQLPMSGLRAIIPKVRAAHAHVVARSRVCGGMLQKGHRTVVMEWMEQQLAKENPDS